MNLEGKRLLLLGGTNIKDDLVDFKRRTGVVFLTTTDEEHANSKLINIVEKSYGVSPLDKDGLISLVVEEKIDGLFAGGNEDIISCAIDVCETCDLPFYASRRQWDITSNKICFKEKCREYGIPVVNEYKITDELYAEDLEKIEYPVIMKPVDACGSRGVTLCFNEEELIENYQYVKSESKTGSVIVEQYMVGTEIVAYFTLKDGEITLSSVSDRFNADGATGLNCLPEAYQYPSKYTKLFIEKYSEAFKKMLVEGLNLRNGLLGVQGFACNGDLTFFEMGFRLGGTSQFRYTKAINGISNLDMLISYSLCGSMDFYPLSLDNALFNRPCCTLTIKARPGIISSVIGVEDVNSMDGVICNEVHYKPGDEVKASSTLAEMVFWVFLVGKDVEDLKILIKKVKATLSVLDEHGEEMLVSDFNPERLEYDL